MLAVEDEDDPDAELDVPELPPPPECEPPSVRAIRIGAEPIIDASTFVNVLEPLAGRNINGPAVLRVPDWIPASERTDPSAQYYIYFADHRGWYIRMAWAAEIEGPWHLWNSGWAPDRAWGDGENTGTRTVGGGVLDVRLSEYEGLPSQLTVAIDRPEDARYAFLATPASPDVFVDDENERIVMFFHAFSIGSAPGDGADDHGYLMPPQHTYVSTSKWGLNFNHGINADPGMGMQRRSSASSTFASSPWTAKRVASPCSRRSPSPTAGSCIAHRP